MKFRNVVKLIVVLVFVVPTFISCNYILENNKNKNEAISEIRTRISIHKQEAKLLLSISRNNLDILELCESIKYVDTQKNVIQLIEKLKKTHFEISKSYSKLAEEKLISIPNYMSINNEFELQDIDSDAFIEKKLKLILNKIVTQIKLLETLGKITNNLDFEVLVMKDTQTLKSNSNKIESALNRLNQEARKI